MCSDFSRGGPCSATSHAPAAELGETDTCQSSPAGTPSSPNVSRSACSVSPSPIESWPMLNDMSHPPKFASTVVDRHGYESPQGSKQRVCQLVNAAGGAR